MHYLDSSHRISGGHDMRQQIRILRREILVSMLAIAPLGPTLEAGQLRHHARNQPTHLPQQLPAEADLLIAQGLVYWLGDNDQQPREDIGYIPE